MSNQKLDGLILASPANPMGAMLEDQQLQTLIDYYRDQGIRFIADEIYHGITYEQKPQTAIARLQA
ncbi:MAG: aminotransferase class I/II-fold pyridoxal phosphate-dependent enzyme [Gammaproteobacteria bacterium]